MAKKETDGEENAQHDMLLSIYRRCRGGVGDYSF